MSEVKENNWEGKNLHELLTPNKLTVAVKSVIEQARTETMIKQQADEWAKNKNK